jgi:hypothetical protein
MSSLIAEETLVSVFDTLIEYNSAEPCIDIQNLHTLKTYYDSLYAVENIESLNNTSLIKCISFAHVLENEHLILLGAKEIAKRLLLLTAEKMKSTFGITEDETKSAIPSSVWKIIIRILAFQASTDGYRGFSTATTATPYVYPYMTVYTLSKTCSWLRTMCADQIPKGKGRRSTSPIQTSKLEAFESGDDQSRILFDHYAGKLSTFSFSKPLVHIFFENLPNNYTRRENKIDIIFKKCPSLRSLKLGMSVRGKFICPEHAWPPMLEKFDMNVFLPDDYNGMTPIKMGKFLGGAPDTLMELVMTGVNISVEHVDKMIEKASDVFHRLDYISIGQFVDEVAVKKLFKMLVNVKYCRMIRRIPFSGAMPGLSWHDVPIHTSMIHLQLEDKSHWRDEWLSCYDCFMNIIPKTPNLESLIIKSASKTSDSVTYPSMRLHSKWEYVSEMLPKLKRIKVVPPSFVSLDEAGPWLSPEAVISSWDDDIEICEELFPNLERSFVSCDVVSDKVIRLLRSRKKTRDFHLRGATNANDALDAIPGSLQKLILSSCDVSDEETSWTKFSDTLRELYLNSPSLKLLKCLSRSKFDSLEKLGVSCTPENEFELAHFVASVSDNVRHLTIGSPSTNFLTYLCGCTVLYGTHTLFPNLSKIWLNSLSNKKYDSVFYNAAGVFLSKLPSLIVLVLRRTDDDRYGTGPSAAGKIVEKMLEAGAPRTLGAIVSSSVLSLSADARSAIKYFPWSPYWSLI